MTDALSRINRLCQTSNAVLRNTCSWDSGRWKWHASISVSGKCFSGEGAGATKKDAKRAAMADAWVKNEDYFLRASVADPKSSPN